MVERSDRRGEPKEEPRCGPDATRLFVQELNDVKDRLNREYRDAPGGAWTNVAWTDLFNSFDNPEGWVKETIKAVVDLLIIFNPRAAYGTLFLLLNGAKMDFQVATLSPQCPNTEECYDTVTLKNVCVKRHTMNDAVFGLCAGFFGVSSFLRWLGGHLAEKALYGIWAKDPPSSRCVYRAAADLGIIARTKPGHQFTADDLDEIVKCAPVPQCAPCSLPAQTIIAQFSKAQWRWPAGVQ